MDKSQVNGVDSFSSKHDTSVEMRRELNTATQKLCDSIIRYVSRPTVVSDSLIKADWILIQEVLEKIHTEYELDKTFDQKGVVE